MPHIRPDCAEQTATHVPVEYRHKPNRHAVRLTRDVLLLRSTGSLAASSPPHSISVSAGSKRSWTGPRPRFQANNGHLWGASATQTTPVWALRCE
jgi:hypothetical protein